VSAFKQTRCRLGDVKSYGNGKNADVQMQMSKMYNAGADANANAYLDPTTNLNFHVNHKPNPTLSL